MKINWKYPQTDYNGLRTWYGILWATPWYILFRIAAGLVWFSIFMADGPDAATEICQRPDV